ncbi:GNAT family N-acetyltransferase [Kribbella sp. NPDC002412]
MIAPRSLTSDVQLRLVTLDDAEGFLDAYNRSWDHLKPWEPDRPDSFFTVAGQRDRLTGALERYKDGRTVPWVLTDGDRVLGAITLNDLVHGPFRTGALAYWLAVDAVGRGLVTRGVETVLEIADTELKLHRLEASTLTNNVASQRVLQRTGFVQIGMAPTYLHIAGAWQDCNLYQRILNDREPGA